MLSSASRFARSLRSNSIARSCIWGEGMFTRRVAYVFFGIMAIGSATIAAGYQSKSLAPPLQPPLGGSNARIVPGAGALSSPRALVGSKAIHKAIAEAAAPSLSLIQSIQAPMTAVANGVLYIEPSEQYPPQEASQPNSAPALSQSLKLRPLSVHEGYHFPHTNSSRPLVHGALPLEVTTEGANNTGVTPWWTYEEGQIGGVGQYLINVANGNLLIQASDMAVPQRGADMTFVRTYNSFSQHDYNNSDGSIVNNYGDGWTNTFDAHIAYNDLSNGTGVSVFDGNGARIDYSKTCEGACIYNAPPGVTAFLYFDSSNDNYYWTSSDGVVQEFYDPNNSTGVAGRLKEIWGRNENTFLAFNYYFDTGGSDSTHLSKIEVSSDSTAQNSSYYATLIFSNFTMSNHSTRRLLSKLIWPDGQTNVTYTYDTSGRLSVVDEPANNAAGTTVAQWYLWNAPYLISTVNGGVWANSNGNAGGFIGFNFIGNALLVADFYGWVNPVVPVPSANPALIQPNFAANYGVAISNPYRQVGIWNTSSQPQPIATPAPAPTGAAACTSSSTVISMDTDGHETVYCWDSSNRVVQTDVWTGSTYLITKETWNAANDRTSFVDPRSQETDYAYDANDNLIAVAKPPQAVGSPRPTTYYSYDSNNNLTAMCDPVESDAAHMDWQTPPPSSDSLCSTAKGFSHFVTIAYVSPAPSYEPFNEIHKVTTPLGYHQTFAYNTSAQDGSDYGLATAITGDGITQFNNTSRTPSGEYYYDFTGNVICSSADGGNSWSVNQYDSFGLGRLLESADPDDASLTQSACPTKSPGIPGSTIVDTRSYYADGSLETSQTPAELAANVESSYTYDLDGNQLSETHNFGYNNGQGDEAPATTTDVYDGADRLVQVELPIDLSDGNLYPWYTNYLYDLTQNSDVELQGMSSGLLAHGNIFTTEEYLGFNPNGTWTDVSGAAYDALDRPTMLYKYPPCNPGNNPPITGDIICSEAPVATQNSYDASSSTLGLLSSAISPLSVTSTYTYDLDDEMTGVSFNDGGVTPNRTYAYDLDGRDTSVTSATYGSEQYQYDADGRVETVTEPTGGGVTVPAVLTYQYYGDSTRQSLVVTATPFPENSTPLFQYAYRTDGMPSALKYDTTNVSGNLSWLFTPAGRPKSQVDPNGTQSDTYDNYGRVATLAVPEGTYNSFTFDHEGDIVSVKGYDNDAQTITNWYTDRGDIAETVPSINPKYWPFSASSYADGYNNTSSTNCDVPGACSQGPPLVGFDARNAVAISGITGQYGSQCLEGNCDYSIVKYLFDNAGRPTSTQGSWCVDSGNHCNSGAVTNTFDAENHVVSTTKAWQLVPSSSCGSSSASGIPQELISGAAYTYGWGPTGQVIIDGSESLHYDGGSLLYSSNSSTGVDDIKVGYVADIIGSGVDVIDRDYAGIASGYHTSTGFSRWDPQLGMQACSPPQSDDQTPSPGMGGPYDTAPLLSLRTDGYWDGREQIQGDRTFDPYSNSWTTPDRDPGSIGDPMSQSAYMWNRNNPETNSDPSGFDSGNCDYRCLGIVTPAPIATPLQLKPSEPLNRGVPSRDGPRRNGGARQPCSGGGIPTTVHLPPGASWSKEFLAGFEHGPIPIGMSADVGQGGRFDYQRWSSVLRGGEKINIYYRPASNFGEGVYFNGAGWSEWAMDKVGEFYASTHSPPGTADVDEPLWNEGWNYAGANCRH